MKKYFAFFFIIFAFAFCILNFSNAQESLPLMISPARQEIIVKPGETSFINVSIYNLSNTPISGIIKVSDFIVDNSQGTPKITENNNQFFSRFSAKNWITYPDSLIKIDNQDKYSLQTKIKVPFDSRPGGHYVAIFFESLSQSKAINETGTDVSMRIASLIYIKVEGKTFEKATVNRFFSPNFYEYGPVKIETQILNRGDYHIAPKGVISMTNIFGQIIYKTKLKVENIFPDTVINYQNDLGGENFLIGRYKINFSGSYGQTGQVLEASTYVWVFPWKLFSVAILAAILIIFIIKKYYKIKQ